MAWVGNKFKIYCYFRFFFKAYKKNIFQIGAAASGPGSAGTYTREVGFISYYEICEKLSKGWTRKYESEHVVPYAFGLF